MSQTAQITRTAQLNELQRSLDAELKNIADIDCTWTEDVAGNRFGWLHLPEPMYLLSAAAVLHKYKARLLTITAYAEERDDQDKKRSIAYHFVVKNTVVTITVRIYDPKTFEKLPVPSITSMFRNADWNEREFHEMFDIEIINHPNPKRLFLDERLDAGIMSSLIPFSTMANGMSSQGLWERVMEEKAGYKPSLALDREISGEFQEDKPRDGQQRAEPAFTPVSATSHMLDQETNLETGQATGQAAGQIPEQATKLAAKEE